MTESSGLVRTIADTLRRICGALNSDTNACRFQPKRILYSITRHVCAPTTILQHLNNLELVFGMYPQQSRRSSPQVRQASLAGMYLVVRVCAPMPITRHVAFAIATWSQ